MKYRTTVPSANVPRLALYHAPPLEPQSGFSAMALVSHVVPPSVLTTTQTPDTPPAGPASVSTYSSVANVAAPSSG